MYELLLEFSQLPKITTNGAQGSWKAKAGNARKWKRIIMILCARGKVPKAPLTFAKLTLTRHSSICPDADGLVASFKPVIDGLVKAGVLIDDNMDVIGMPSYLWKKAPPRAGFITIKVEAP